MKTQPAILADKTAVASVEFAILGAVFFIIIFGILGSGLLLWTKNTITAAAIMTARCVAISSPDCTNVAQYAVTQATNWTGIPIISTSNVSWITATACNSVAGTFAVVSITSRYWAAVLPPPFTSATLTASACYPMNAVNPFS